MTDILCNWLNNEVKLSRHIDATNLAREFSTGYLVGEVLSKYGLQDDFDQFSQNKTMDSKLNNFTRVEPILALLQVPFDTNTARDVMTEQHGTATKMLYQLFIALNRKEKSNLTGVAIEAMRAPAPVKLENAQSEIYKERLKHMTPRQTDQNLDTLVARFHEKQIEMEQIAFKERFEEEQRQEEFLMAERERNIKRYKEKAAAKADMLAKINYHHPSQELTESTGAATVHIPKPPPNRTAKAVAQRRELNRQHEARLVKMDIDTFEEKMKRTLPASKPIGDAEEVAALPDNIDYVKPKSNDEYIGKIRKNLEENAAARAEREKRRRKVLVDQLKAHEAQEEARREEMLVNRLMRQSQQERRIAVQLLQARHEKDVIRNNRMTREKQYEERRLREFEDALNKEAELARLAKLEYVDQTQKDKELHDRIAQERAEARYKKHYDMCMETLLSVVDFSTKVGEYRELTNKLVPEKLMREWCTLFVAGQPLYETVGEINDEEVEAKEPSAEQVLEDERKLLLDEGDFNEYRNMIGAWNPPETCDIEGPPRNNPIVGHIVQRLFNIVHPPSPPPPPPEFPEFPIKACVLGKAFSGKTSICQQLADSHRLKMLSSDELVKEAIEAHKNGELKEEPQEVQEEASSKIESEQVSAAVESPAPGSTTAASVPAAAEDISATVPAVPEEGTEKGDAEKPVPLEEQTIQSEAAVDENAEDASDAMMTDRAKLGQKAMRLLKRGRPVDDQLTVDIIIEAIRRLPDGTGWILDGFPATYNQAKLLEKALSGIDAMSRESSTTNLKNKGGKKSQLAPDPKPAPPPPEPKSGINVVILFDVPDEVALRRTAGRSYNAQTDEEYQQEFKPPPDGSITGMGKVEKVLPVEDPAHDQEQIQHRLTVFQDAWPKLEKWFTKYGLLKGVDATQETETVYLEVEKILEDTLEKLSGKEEAEVLTVEPEEKLEEKPAEVEEQKPAEPEPEPPKEEPEKASRPGSKKSRSGELANSKSPKRSRSGGKKAKTPEPEPEPEPEVPPGTPPPQPGSDEWQYIEQAIEEDLAKVLSTQWEEVEKAYIDSSKNVFHDVRDERENIIRYFYQIRQNYQEYLKRPDHKQEFLAAWQKDYNSMSDDLRDDEETRSELHQQVDDLRERLWNICDERKEQAEKERSDVMNEGWLEDRLALLSNLYITLMQGEVDRYQDTVRMLKDYYKGMEGKIPEEFSPEYARIPLIEIPATDKIETGSHASRSRNGSAVGSGSGAQGTSQADGPGDASPSKSRTPSGKRKGKPHETEQPQTEAADTDRPSDKPRIPLVPRRPTSPDQGTAGKGKDKAKEKGKKEGKGGDATDTPIPNLDLDEKLIHDAHLAGIAAVDKIVLAEQAAREAEEEAEREAQLAKEKEKMEKAQGKKGKGKGKGKSRSPSPKKGAAAAAVPATPQPQEEETDEAKEKMRIKERSKQEFFAAVEEEAKTSKTRLDLIRVISLSVIADLKSKADNAYKDMNDWLGARFLKEMESIDHMSVIVRNAIEASSHITDEIVIIQDHFNVNKDMRVIRTPTPPPRPLPTEEPPQSAFTVKQIVGLYNQLTLTAPTGVIAAKSFQEMLLDLVSLTHGAESLPDVWMNMSNEKLEALVTLLSPGGEYIDWRSFLLTVSRPWPEASQTDLLVTLERFKEMDQQSLGTVTREQFDRVDLWFGAAEKPPSPDDPQEPLRYDRLENVKNVFFDIFADHQKEPVQLDYTDMLLYFSTVSDAYEGFLRALSVATGTPMPRKSQEEIKAAQSRPASQASVRQEPTKSEEELADNEVQQATDAQISETSAAANVPLDALDRVLHHGQSMRGDSHRFSVTADPEDACSRERLAGVYQELGTENCEPVPFTSLIEHPIIQDIVSSLQTYKTIEFSSVFSNSTGGQEATDTHSVKTGE